MVQLNQAFINPHFVQFQTKSRAFISRRGSRALSSQKRAARLPPFARAKDSTALEDALLAAISKLKETEASLHLYSTRMPEKFADATAAAADLERTSLGFGASIKRLPSLLPGTWRLILTDSKAVEKNGGSITGLGSLPGARCLNVEVRLELDGKASTVERVKVLGGLLDGENTLEGKWKLEGDQLEVTYARAILMGKAKVRADSKAVLRTSYCSQRVRIGRSAGGELYVFVKD